MFATLVIVLPTAHTGGQTRVWHDGRQMTLDVSKSCAFGAAFTVLYTDVDHQVEPVESGLRLALSYNLVSPADADKPTPKAPIFDQTLMDRLREELKKRLAMEDDGKPILAHRFAHKYSEVGLSTRTIKGQDRVKFEYLSELARELHLSIYLAQVTGFTSYMPANDEEEPAPKFVIKSATDHNGLKVKHLENMRFHSDDFTPWFLRWRENVDEQQGGGYMGNYSACVLWSPTVFSIELTGN